MQELIRKVVGAFGFNLVKRSDSKPLKKIYQRYKGHTMIRSYDYCENLAIVENHVRNIEGDVIECGVWRGGMIAGIAELLGKTRHYYLFDSFEGLPDAQEIDGGTAKQYQENKQGDWYFDNCSAEISFAEKAMHMSGADHTIVRGWFKDSLKNFESPKIALLRLDGDWYESTLDCLVNLYPKVVKGGVIIIDDYYMWDGCSKAVHDYLSQIKSASRINKSPNGISYIIKKDL
jgi:O-methyltransferase